MKKSICLIALLVTAVSFTIAQDTNVIFETAYLDAKMDQLEDLRKNIKNHNQTFHGPGPYAANVWRVMTGERSGQMLITMGPFTFADLDNRPGVGDHNDDWIGKVLPLVHSIHDGYYWKMMTDYSYAPSENYQGKLMQVRTLDIKRGKMQDFMDMMTLINKVYQEKQLGHSFGVFDNVVVDQNRDVAVVWQYDNYAYMDRQSEFGKNYDEVHGDNSWWRFNEAMREIVVSTNDELFERMPGMSAE